MSDQSGYVRVYGPDGSFRYRFGGRGGGPGEFRVPRLSGGSAAITLVVGDHPGM